MFSETTEDQLLFSSLRDIQQADASSADGALTGGSWVVKLREL